MTEAFCSLNKSTLSRLHPRQFFNKYKSPYLCLDFSPNGTRLIATSENNFISLYDVVKGEVVKTINSDVYGAGYVVWGAHPEVVIVSSTKTDDNVRYLSLYDNKYIRVFSGHTAKVNLISVSPDRDQLLTSSDDKTVRLWDMRVNECTHRLDCGDSTVVATTDPEGLVVGVGLDSKNLQLYDFRFMSTGPFQIFPISDDPKHKWTKIKFSPKGNIVMVNTNSSTGYLVDAFNGQWTHVMNESDSPMDAKLNYTSDYSSDERYVFSGTSNGMVSIYETKTFQKLMDIKSKHIGPVTHTLFNPIFRVLATASDELHLWM